MDLTLNLFWSQEIPVAENYGFHLETTTSPNHLAGKPGVFWTCEPKPMLGLSGSQLISMPLGSLNSCSLALIPSPQRQQSLLVQNATFEPFCVFSYVKPKHSSTARQRFLSAAQKQTGENGKCHRVFKWFHMKIHAFQITVRTFFIFKQLYWFSHPLSHNFLLSYVQLKVL